MASLPERDVTGAWPGLSPGSALKRPVDAVLAQLLVPAGDPADRPAGQLGCGPHGQARFERGPHGRPRLLLGLLLRGGADRQQRGAFTLGPLAALALFTAFTLLALTTLSSTTFGSLAFKVFTIGLLLFTAFTKLPLSTLPGLGPLSSSRRAACSRSRCSRTLPGKYANWDSEPQWTPAGLLAYGRETSQLRGGGLAVCKPSLWQRCHRRSATIGLGPSSALAGLLAVGYWAQFWAQFWWSQPSNQTTRRTPSSPCRFASVRMTDQTAPHSLSGTASFRRRRPTRKSRSPSGHSVFSGKTLPAE